MIKKIGIVGGGQLGRMLAQAARKLGFFVTVLDPTKNSPAAQVADKQIQGSFKDMDKILELGEVSDVVTFEIESANSEALERMVTDGKEVYPSPKSLKIIKDKFGQKVFLENHDIPVANFALIENEDDIEKQSQIFGFPFLLKSRFDAYDGRGNYVVKNKEDISNAVKKLGDVPLYAEKLFPFIKELAVISVRGKNGEIITYPVVETVHKNNICHIVRSPAPVKEEVRQKAKILAEKVLNSLGDVGTYAVEMFLGENDEILVNEIAPRVHNSGHHTIEAFSVSQFEAHIRAITGMPLSEPTPLANSSVMVNILGERDGEALIKGGDTGENGIFTHIYGKMDTRKERKMGHITALGDDPEKAEKRAMDLRNNLKI